MALLVDFGSERRYTSDIVNTNWRLDHKSKKKTEKVNKFL